MRFILIIVLLAGAGFAGWIAGSLHPAPAAISAPIQAFLANTASEADQTDSELEGTDVVDPIPDPAPDPVVTSPGASSSTTDPTDTLDQYRLWISEARAQHPYPESEEKMFEVMMCESGGRANIVNPAGPYSGLFQYVAGTWAGDWNQYRDSDILDARAQIFATALAWNNNMQSHWGCYSRSH
ncbi:MAG: hypothetical protein AAGA89_10690 [Pseudomonadota bacterium]